MLDERDHAGGHEATDADGLSRSRDLGHLDDAAPGRRDLHPAPRLRRLDLVGPHAVARVHDDLDPVSFHSADGNPRGPGERSRLRSPA